MQWLPADETVQEQSCSRNGTFLPHQQGKNTQILQNPAPLNPRVVTCGITLSEGPDWHLSLLRAASFHHLSSSPFHLLHHLLIICEFQFAPSRKKPLEKLVR